MKETHTLKSLSEVRALANPLRLRILETLRVKPMTTKNVAIQLGEKPTRLYHHVDALERAGLIRLIETKKNRGTVEKYYSAIAGEFIVDRKLLELSQGDVIAARGYDSLLLTALEATLAEARASVAAKPVQSTEAGRKSLAWRQQLRLTEEQVGKFTEKIRGWIAECQATESSAEGDVFNLTLVFYPVKETEPNREPASKARSSLSTPPAQKNRLPKK